MIGGIFVAIFILSFLVLLHEFFHFLMAKKSNVLVEEFGIGLPPKIFGKKIGKTLFSLNLLPFGGFVKLYGEEKEKDLQKEISFAYQSPKIKTKILLAGALANLFFAILLFYLILAINKFEIDLPGLFEKKVFFGNSSQYLVITQTMPDSPAQKVQLKPYDIILNVDGKEFNQAKEFIEYVYQKRGQEITLIVRNLKEKDQREIVVVPRENPPQNQGPLGIAIGSIIHLKYSTTPQKIFSGFLHSFNILEYSFKVFGELFKISFAQKTISPLAYSVSGPVGIFYLIEMTFKEGMIALLNLVALLSLSLGVINLLPIPATDGGRMIFVFWEALSKKPVPEKIERGFNAIGYYFLIILLLILTFKDIKQFFLP